MLNDAKFWLATLERAIVAFSASLIAVIGSTQVGITDIEWFGAFSISATAAILSILTAVVSGTATGRGPATFGPETTAPETILVEVPAKPSEKKAAPRKSSKK
jgi:hypothetical protein